MTDVHTYYGFKGGTGRSLLMAHIASMLAVEGKKVLMIDADFEAPGLGDFFDKTEIERTESIAFERWRGVDGLMDLMRELVRQQQKGGLGDEALDTAIRKRMLENGGLLRPDPKRATRLAQLWLGAPDGAEIQLLGPGNHRASSDLGAQHYLANFLDFDWNAFLRQGGPRILEALGVFWRSGAHGFDHVLIDTRTGYNLPSILLIRHWATHLIGVSSWSWQSIDGMARMLPVARRVQWQDTPIPTFLVMNKTTPPDREQSSARQSIQRILERYFDKGVGGIQRIELPYAQLLQTHDRMAWATLDWNRYIEARQRVNERQKAKPESPYHGLNELYEEAIVLFCDGIAKLQGCLTGRVGNSDTLPIFKKLFQHFATTSSFNAQARTPDGETKRRMTLEEVLEHIRKWLASEADNQNETVSDSVLESFSACGRVDRALWRNAVLDLVKENSAGQGDLGTVVESRLKELKSRFTLDLDPTSAAEHVVTAIKRGGDDETEIDPETAISRTIHALYKDPLSDEAGERIESLTARIGGFAEQAAAVTFLRRYHAATDPNTNALDAITALASLAEKMTEVVRIGRPPIPDTRASFIKFNLFDLIHPLAMRTGETLRRAGVAQARLTITELSVLSNVLIQHLWAPAPWEGFTESEDLREACLQRRQWLYYVQGAVRLRLLGDPTAAALAPKEAAALRQAAILPDLEECTGWAWSNCDTVTVADTCSFEAAVASLTLGSGVRAESAQVMVIAKALLEQALANRMAVMESETSKRDHRLAQIWDSLLEAVTELVGPARTDDGLCLKAARRSVRLLATNGVGVGFGHAESVATRAMAAVYALGHRLSASAWNKAFVRHAEADAIPSTENGDADAQSNWYEAVTLMDEGRFRAAVDLFDIENKALKDDEAAAILRSKLVFYFHALTELGRRDTAESILPHAKHSLAAASQGLGFSDDEFRVSLVVSHAKMLFYLEEDAAALDALDELDALDPVLLAANNTATFARIYRGLLGHEDDDIDLPATVEANLTRLFQALSAGPDRVAAQSAGVAWHGSGLFCAGSPHAWLDRKLVSLFEPAILHSIRRGRRDDACAILKQWVRLAEGRALDDAVPENTPTRNHAAALIAAFRAELGPPKERDGRVAEAWTHRQVDLEANGSERAFVYRRAFTLCGIG